MSERLRFESRTKFGLLAISVRLGSSSTSTKNQWNENYPRSPVVAANSPKETTALQFLHPSCVLKVASFGLRLQVEEESENETSCTICKFTITRCVTSSREILAVSTINTK
uniref:Uncharacterized protein n=1 Tax=Timema poppense TaxID=170557 RepID=A0A7R9HE35_TIMPO|nr:unnamed protein product [Timema poppensis]